MHEIRTCDLSYDNWKSTLKSCGIRISIWTKKNYILPKCCYCYSLCNGKRFKASKLFSHSFYFYVRVKPVKRAQMTLPTKYSLSQTTTFWKIQNRPMDIKCNFGTVNFSMNAMQKSQTFVNRCSKSEDRRSKFNKSRCRLLTRNCHSNPMHVKQHTFYLQVLKSYWAPLKTLL